MVLKGKIKPYLLLTLVPFFVIGVFCLRYGQNFLQYYLPNSQWNDELIYYKTVEGIVNYGIPQGYYGYNESHAVIGTFGAWSPLVYVIDALLGTVLGWKFHIPIIIRILFAVAGFAIYALYRKPSAVNTALIATFCASFTLYGRYLASQMADCYITTLLIVFVALKYTDHNKEKSRGIALTLTVVMLTLIRPYFALLWLVVSENKETRKDIIKHISIAVASIAAYFAIARFFTAAYFTSLINTDWIKLIFNSPVEGIKNLFAILGVSLTQIHEYITAAFVRGDDVGLQYFIFYVETLILVLLTIKEKQWKWISWTILNVMLWFAIVLLYDVRVGSRHLMPFIVAEAILLIEETGPVIKSLMVLIPLYLCLFRFSDPYMTTYPMYSHNTSEQLAEMSEELTAQIAIDSDDRWNNTLIWTLSDVDGTYPWQTLYSLPAGMGINICTYEYVTGNFDDLNSRYIACTSGGDVSKMCRTGGWELILDREDENICIYRRN